METAEFTFGLKAKIAPLADRNRQSLNIVPRSPPVTNVEITHTSLWRVLRRCHDFFVVLIWTAATLIRFVLSFRAAGFTLAQWSWGAQASPPHDHVKGRKKLSPCGFHPSTPLTAGMASAYPDPAPFDSSGEVKEGFLCPLCLKDLQSFYQLQEHYEEEHSGDERPVRGQLKSELPPCTCELCFVLLTEYSWLVKVRK